MMADLLRFDLLRIPPRLLPDSPEEAAHLAACEALGVCPGDYEVLLFEQLAAHRWQFRVRHEVGTRKQESTWVVDMDRGFARRVEVLRG